MTADLAVRNRVRNVPPSASPSERATAEDASRLDRLAIARLSHADISSLARDELIRVVHNAGIPFLAGRALERLRFCSRETLERLAHLGRHCCRNRGD